MTIGKELDASSIIRTAEDFKQWILTIPDRALMSINTTNGNVRAVWVPTKEEQKD